MRKRIKLVGAPKVHQLLGRELDANRFSYAIEVAQWHLGLHPDDARVWYRLGVAQAGLWHYAEAERAFEKALELVGEEPLTKAWIWQSRGEMYENLGRLREAVVCYRKAIEAKPDNLVHWEALGVSLRHQGDVAGEEAVAREAVAANEKDSEGTPISSGYLAYLGHVLQFQGRLEEAVECYERVAAQGSDSSSFLKQLSEAQTIRSQRVQGKAPLDLESSREAIRHSEEKWRHLSSVELMLWHLEWYPDDSLMWAELGRFRCWLGQYDAALVAYQRALEVAPETEKAAIYGGMAKASGYRGDVESAEKWVRLALDAGGAAGDLRIELGGWYCRRGDLARAEEIYREGLELGEEVARRIYFHLGEVLIAQGRVMEAREFFGKVEKSNPYWEWAQGELREQRKIRRLRRWKSRRREGAL